MEVLSDGISSSDASSADAARIPVISPEWYSAALAAAAATARVTAVDPIADRLIDELLPAAFAAACPFARFTVDRGLPTKSFYEAVTSLFAEICCETEHPAVHVETRDGNDWVTRPITFFVRNARSALARWLRAQQRRGFLKPLNDEDLTIRITWYWDKMARTIGGYPCTLLLVSFPQLFRRPAALHSVFPLVVHAGARPAFVPDKPARPKEGARKAEKARHGKPAVREATDTICCDILNSLTSIDIPEECVPQGLRDLGVSDLPVELLCISDQAAVSEISDDVAHGSSIKFPAKWSEPSKRNFVNGLGTRPSAECMCTSAQILLPGTACASGRSRGPLHFFTSSPNLPPVVCRRLYCRHALMHGHPCVAGDIACLLWRSGFRREAELICKMLPAPYDPLIHLRGRQPDVVSTAGDHGVVEPAVPAPPRAGGDAADGDAAEDAAANPERPMCLVRLSYVTDQLREAELGVRYGIIQREGALACAVAGKRPSLLDILDILRATRLTFPLPATGLSRFARPDPTAPHPGFYTVAQHHHDVVTYAIWCMHPDSEGAPSAQEIAALGRDVFVRHKAMLETSVPWSAPNPADGRLPPPWYRRLQEAPNGLDHLLDVQRIRFCANATSLAQSLHEFFLGASAAVVLCGKTLAQSIQEEAFERILLYWWLITFVMGGLLSSREARLRFSVTLLYCAVYAGCPTMQRVSAADAAHRAYQGKKRLRHKLHQPVPSNGDAPELFGYPLHVSLPKDDAARSPSRRPATAAGAAAPDPDPWSFSSDLWDAPLRRK